MYAGACKIFLLTTPSPHAYNNPKAMTERDGNRMPPESRRVVKAGGGGSQVLWLLSRMFEGVFFAPCRASRLRRVTGERGCWTLREAFRRLAGAI